MAWIEYMKGKTKGSWPISFRPGGQRFNRSLKTDDKREAETRQARLEENIRFVENGLFPRVGVRLPKAKELPIIQTREEIRVRRFDTAQLSGESRSDRVDPLPEFFPEETKR